MRREPRHSRARRGTGAVRCGHVCLRMTSRRGDTRAHGLELRRDRDTVQQGDRGEQRPEQQRHEPGERSVGLPEGRAQPEEAPERDRDEQHQDDRQEGADREPGPPGLATAGAPAEDARGCADQQRERQRPADDVPDIPRGGVVEHRGQPLPGRHRHERDDGQETGADGEHERAPVLPQGGTVALDAVEAVHRALDLPEQRGPGDDGSDRSQRECQRTTLPTSLVRLLDRVRQDRARGPREDVPEHPDDGVADPSLPERARQANESDDALHQDQGCDEGHRASVAEPVGGPQPFERVPQQPDGARRLQGLLDVRSGQFPGLGDWVRGAHRFPSSGTQTEMAPGFTLIFSRLVFFRSPPSSW